MPYNERTHPQQGVMALIHVRTGRRRTYLYPLINTGDGIPPKVVVRRKHSIIASHLSLISSPIIIGDCVPLSAVADQMDAIMRELFSVKSHPPDESLIKRIREQVVQALFAEEATKASHA